MVISVRQAGHEGPRNHQFGGFLQTLQNGLQARSQLAANGSNCGSSEIWETDDAKELLKSVKDWCLVSQIGVDRHAGIPQLSAYYVVMREQDIAARRFELARVDLPTRLKPIQFSWCFHVCFGAILRIR
jgi:hypothetical protein